MVPMKKVDASTASWTNIKTEVLSLVGVLALSQNSLATSILHPTPSIHSGFIVMPMSLGQGAVVVAVAGVLVSVPVSTGVPVVPAGH